MPSLPKFIYGLRKKRAVEVWRHFNAHHLPHTVYNIHNTGEFAIKLQGVKKNSRNNNKAAVFLIVIKHIIYKDCRSVCNNNLFEKPPNNELHAEIQIFKIEIGAFIELSAELIPSCNGAFNNREHKRKIKRYAQRIFFRFKSASVNIR